MTSIRDFLSLCSCTTIFPDRPPALAAQRAAASHSPAEHLPTARSRPIASRAIGRGPVALLVLLIAGPTTAQQLDPQFAPSFDNTVRAIARQADGTVIVGGDFRFVNGQDRYALARLAPDGTLFPPLPAKPNNVVLATAIDASGRILVGGRFSSIGQSTTLNIGRLLADGTLDTSFVSGLLNNGSSEVKSVAVLPNGKIAISGSFDTSSGRVKIALLNSDGSVDTGFNWTDLTTIKTMAVTQDNRILVAGTFRDQDPRCSDVCVIRLGLNGVIDTSFSATAVDASRAMSVQANGSILVAGPFSLIDNHTSYFVGRILPNGGPDTSFSTTAILVGPMAAVQQQADGKILIAGNWRWAGDTIDAKRVARLTSSGARDTSFNEPVFNDPILALSLSPNFDFIVCGYFGTANGITRNYLAQFIAARPDPVFNSGFD